MEGKTPSASITEMTEIVLPSDSNTLGSAFGGKVMQWIDICAAIAAQRHCRSVVVTASIEGLAFHAPIKVGSVAQLRARVNAAFAHSLEVGVDVDGENPQTGDRRRCCSALLTFAALDGAGKPTSVPPLIPESDEDRARLAAAEARRADRLARRSRIPGAQVPAAK